MDAPLALLGTDAWAEQRQVFTHSLVGRVDFSWPIDMLLVPGLAITLWQPAMSHARALSIATAAVVVFWLAAGLPT